MEQLVSVIIPTFNRSDIICNCIDSVLKSTYKNLEIIVVDNKSEDNTVDLVNERFDDNPAVCLIRLSKNIMASGGRNAGILRAKGDIIIFLDSDNIIEKDMIAVIVDFYIDHPEAGLIAPVSINGEQIWTLGSFHNLYTSRSYSKGSGININSQLEPFYKTDLSPNCFCVKHDVLERVGGFDYSYGIMFEESDFGIRIKNCGYENYIVSDARTHHYHGLMKGENLELRNLGIGTKQRAFAFARNRVLFEKKFAKWYQYMIFIVAFNPLFTLYYAIIAIRNKKMDIAVAIFKGSIKGTFSRSVYSEYIDITRETEKWIIGNK